MNIIKQNKVLIFLIIIVVISAIFGTNLFKKEEKPVPPLTKVSVALDWFPWSGQAGFWVAKEKGYFAGEGLDVELNIPSDPTTVLKTVAAGRDDFGVSYAADVLIARNSDAPVVSIMVLVQHPLNTVVTLKESDIERPRDLVGKKVGTSGNPTSHGHLDSMLKNDGIPGGIKEVELVNIGFDYVPALTGKKVDALAGSFKTFENIMLTNQGFSINVMELVDYGVPDHYEISLVTNEEIIAKNPDLVQRFTQAVKRGYEDAIADSEEAVQIMKKLNTELDLSVDIPGAKLLVPLWRPENGVFGWQEEKRWMDFGNWMKENDLISKDLDVKAAFDNSFVENASKE